MYRKALVIWASTASNVEIADEILSWANENERLRAQVEQAQAEVSKLSKLAFDMAVTSDRMKLDLILCGALRSPKAD
jgi:hypothetical protein